MPIDFEALRLALMLNLAVVLSWLVLGTIVDYAQELGPVLIRRR